MTNDRWRSLLRVAPHIEHVPRGLYISRNDKTGLSINVSIADTCRPTKACAQYCYGLSGRIRMDASLRRYAQNAARFDYLAKATAEEVKREAYWVAQEALREQDFLRFFGVGDLQEGSVLVINELGIVAPDLRLWITSRKPELARLITPVPSANLMLSRDHSTKDADVAAMRRIIHSWNRKQARAFFAWTQTSEDDIAPPEAEVIFAQHKGPSRAPWTLEQADERTCPATIRGGAEHSSACTVCRFCINPKR